MVACSRGPTRHNRDWRECRWWLDWLLEGGLLRWISRCTVAWAAGWTSQQHRAGSRCWSTFRCRWRQQPGQVLPFEVADQDTGQLMRHGHQPARRRGSGLVVRSDGRPGALGPLIHPLDPVHEHLCPSRDGGRALHGLPERRDAGPVLAWCCQLGSPRFPDVAPDDLVGPSGVVPDAV